MTPAIQSPAAQAPAQSPRTNTGSRIHLTRTIPASRERVFQAWTQPDQIRQWMAPKGWVVVEVEADARTGGKYRKVLRGTPPPASPEAKPQEVTGSAHGTYLEVVPNELIRYTWNADWSPGEETIVTIRLSDVAGGTLLELIHENFTTAESSNGHNQGWESILDRLPQFLEG